MVALIIIIMFLVSLLMVGVYYHHHTLEMMKTVPKAPSIETVCILCDRHGREVSRRSFADGRDAPPVMTRHSNGGVMHYDYVTTNDKGEHLYQLRKA